MVKSCTGAVRIIDLIRKGYSVYKRVDCDVAVIQTKGDGESLATEAGSKGVRGLVQ